MTSSQHKLRSYDHAPIDIIKQQYQQHQQYITSHEIAAQVVQDEAAKSLIQHAQSQQRKIWSPEQIAHNMVAWFSQRITIGNSVWTERFERTKIEGRWAYKPVSDTPMT
jgi:hypothetical protein